MPINTWTHVAVQRAADKLSMWMDGIKVASTDLENLATRSGNRPGTLIDQSTELSIGYGQGGGNSYFIGYLQDIRITKGLAVYSCAANSTEKIDMCCNATWVRDDDGFDGLSIINPAGKTAPKLEFGDTNLKSVVIDYENSPEGFRRWSGCNTWTGHTDPPVRYTHIGQVWCHSWAVGQSVKYGTIGTLDIATLPILQSSPSGSMPPKTLVTQAINQGNLKYTFVNDTVVFAARQHGNSPSEQSTWNNEGNIGTTTGWTWLTTPNPCYDWTIFVKYFDAGDYILNNNSAIYFFKPIK
jgi:hypothetical protein